MIKKVETRIIEIPVRKAKSLNDAYADYCRLINTRLAAGETELELKSIDDWKRIITLPDGTEKVVAGESGETRTARATRVGNRYLRDALQSVRRMKNLGSSQYQFTPKQINVIVNELATAVSEVNHALNGSAPETSVDLGALAE